MITYTLPYYQVRDLKSKTNKDASRIAGNERKLNESREAVHQATLTIYKVMGEKLFDLM